MFRVLISIPLILLPLLFGGATVWHQAIVFSLFLLWLSITIWTKESVSLPGIGSRWAILFGLLLCVPFLQALPLPLDWIEVLSPERRHWIEQAMAVTGIESAWTSLSYTPLKTLFAGTRWLLLCYRRHQPDPPMPGFKETHSDTH